MKKRTMISDYVKEIVKTGELAGFMPYSNADEYAKYIGASHTVIYDIMKGKCNSPSPLTAVRMCKWFNLEPDKLFEMINMPKNKELFLEKFYDKYNGINFKNKCMNTIESFVNMYEKMGNDNNNIYYYYDEDEKYASLSNLKLVNVEEKSIYDPRAYNATCEYTLYVDKMMETDEGTGLEPVELKNYTCTLYYLPTRRIRKKSDNIYADEEIRDFVNKFIYLITSKEAPLNNLFITSSKNLYDKIHKYLNDIDIKPTLPNLGITLIYQPTGWAFNNEFTHIINNNNEIELAFIFNYHLDLEEDI